MKTHQLSATLAALTAMTCVGYADAAPIATYEGTQLDMTAWRTASTTKDVDPDGDDIIGTLGYHLFGAAGERTTALNGANGSLADLPSSIAVTRNTGSELQYGYALIDNPVDGSPASIVSGTTSGSSGVTAIATISFSAGVASELTMTLLQDNLDGAGFNTSGYQIRASDGTTILASTSASNDNTDPDWHYFSLSGLSAGDSIQVWSSGGSYATLGGVAFDVPEPGSLALLAAGGLCVLRRRRD